MIGKGSRVHNSAAGAGTVLESQQGGAILLVEFDERKDLPDCEPMWVSWRAVSEIEPIAIANGWAQSAAGALWTRTLASGQLAAIWSYTDSSGTFYKLLTDRDLGDYVDLAGAMAVAELVETSKVLA